MDIKNILYIFLCSMVPIIELRVAIPMGAALDIPFYINYIISVVGNMLPVPFILLFIRHILHWMKKIPKLDKIAAWIENKAEKNKAKVLKYATFGLYIFVAIPLPGTGAWTGALVAAMLDMRLKRAFPAIALGVLGAAAIVTFATYGIDALFFR